MKKKLCLIIILFMIIIYRLIDLKIINYGHYYNDYINKSNNIINGLTAPRGKILDTNGKVIVDNEAINNINYRKLNNIKNSEEKEIAQFLSHTLNLNTKASELELKKYYLENNDTTYLLTDEEKELFKYRKLNEVQINDIKLNRLNDEIKNYSADEMIIIHTYYLMQAGYTSDSKIILSDVNATLCARITESNIKGVSCDVSWKRVNHSYILSSIIGSIGLIPKESLDNYLNLGYSKDDIVGLSGLEKQYDTLLKGNKAQYLVNSDNSLKLVKEEERGQDITLAIDLDMEEYAYNVLQEHLLMATKFNNTDFYNHAYILVSNPHTGEIITIAGLRYNADASFSEISSDALLSSYTVGSIVKGASNTVGYLNDLIDVGKKINDACVKLYSVPEKCSFKRLGLIDDISALKMSSNYYQFITAIKSTGNKYVNNIKMDVNEDNFNLYRDVFKLYGLGAKTGIDYPKESLGIKGSKIAPDLLLNLAIGQYDSYTPLQLLAYINTIANNGVRLNLSFLKQENQVSAVVNLDSYYMNRIQEGFYQVVNAGTGRGYSDYGISAVGKTGTAENYYDAKTTTITQSYIMYAPRDNPKYSLVIVNPNISFNNDTNKYIAPINRLISKKMSDYLFKAS